MTEYTIAAIPTVYRGRQYRSRLEAKWAAFFDLMGWEAEYEPFDLGMWSPDFLIRGRDGNDVLVEVKPITEFCPDVAKKAVEACFRRGLADNLSGVLIVGTCPFRTKEQSVQLGWFGCLDCEKPEAWWQPTEIIWVQDAASPVLYPVFRYRDLAPYKGKYHWSSCISDDFDFGPNFTISFPYIEYIETKWSEACNAVQWKPPS